MKNINGLKTKFVRVTLQQDLGAFGVIEYQAYSLLIDGVHHCFVEYEPDLKEWFAYKEPSTDSICSGLTRKECLESILLTYKTN